MAVDDDIIQKNPVKFQVTDLPLNDVQLRVAFISHISYAEQLSYRTL